MTTTTEGFLVKIKAGEQPPDTFWTAIVKTGINAYGAALVSEGDLYAQGATGVTPETADTLKQLRGHFLDNEIVFAFEYAQNPDKPEELQPFILQREGTNTDVAVAFLEGDFDHHIENGSMRPATYQAAQNVLFPLWTQYWDLTGGSLDKVMQTLANPINTHTINSMSGIRGCVIILAKDGTFLVYDNAPDSVEYPWGFLSRPVPGFSVEGPGPGITVVEEPTRKLSKGEQMALLMKGGKVETKPPEAVVTPPPLQVAATAAIKPPSSGNVLQLAPKTAELASTTAMPDRVTTVTLRNLKDKNKKAILQKYFGTLPPDWKEMLEIRLVNGRPVSPLPPKPPVATETGTTAAQALPVGATASVPPVSQPELPLIPMPMRLEVLNNFHANILKKLNGVPPDIAATIKAFEENVPTFTQQTGIPIDQTFAWTHTDCLNLCRERPEAAAVYIRTLLIPFMKSWKAPAKPEMLPIKQAKTG